MIEFQYQSWISNAESIIFTVATLKKQKQIITYLSNKPRKSVPADKITQNNNSHAQIYFHKNSRQFLLSKYRESSFRW